MKDLNKKQFEMARQKIKKFYNLNRYPTDKEVNDEINSINRHSKNGTLDDFYIVLCGILSVGKNPIKFDPYIKNF